MTDALEDHEGTVGIGSRTITNLRFADDIDGLAGEEEELANLVEHLDKASTAYGMEISAEKAKLMTNNTNGINRQITVNGQTGSVKQIKMEKSDCEVICGDPTARPSRLRDSWAELSWSSIFSTDNGIAYPPGCPEGRFWRGCRGARHVRLTHGSGFRLYVETRCWEES